MQQPSGFLKTYATLVYQLKKSIYGLKQASRAWYEKLHHALIQFGFISSQCYHSLFIYPHLNIIMYAVIYVDDILKCHDHLYSINSLIACILHLTIKVRVFFNIFLELKFPIILADPSFSHKKNTSWIFLLRST